MHDLYKEKFFIRNAEFEVLFTQEDIYPDRCYSFNNVSVVLRMNAGGQSVMWLGDAELECSDILYNRYGDYIKSDIAQVAHHGYVGVSKELYSLIAPHTLLWPCSQADYAYQTNGSTDSFFGVALFLVNELGAKKIYVAQNTVTIALPYRP